MGALSYEPNPTPASTTQPETALFTFSRSLGSPVLGTTTYVMAATGASAALNVSTGLTNPDVPRNVTATTTGTAANVTAQQVVVTGTDIEGNALTETLPAFTAGSNTTVTGAKAFATVTNISCPAVGSGVNVAIGTSSKLGLTRRMSRDLVERGYLNGVRESTRPTGTFDPVNICNNTVALVSALNGTPVIVDYVSN